MFVEERRTDVVRIDADDSKTLNLSWGKFVNKLSRKWLVFGAGIQLVTDR
jgi:hypothetical protein